MMNSGIYQIRNTINGRVYVGSAVNVRVRWSGHVCQLNQGCHDNGHLQNAWRKYGGDAFVFEKLESVEPENLIEHEQQWMDLLNVTESGYNISPTAGSQLGMKHSLETRRKIGLSSKWRIGENNSMFGKKHTMETRTKISKALKGLVPWNKGKVHLTGEKNPMHGKKHTAEALAKMREARKGQIVWNKGKTHMSGEKNPMYGKRHSEETRAKMRMSHWSRSDRSEEIKIRSNKARERRRLREIDLELKPFFDAIFRKRKIA